MFVDEKWLVMISRRCRWKMSTVSCEYGEVAARNECGRGIRRRKSAVCTGHNARCVAFCDLRQWLHPSTLRPSNTAACALHVYWVGEFWIADVCVNATLNGHGDHVDQCAHSVHFYSCAIYNVQTLTFMFSLFIVSRWVESSVPWRFNLIFSLLSWMLFIQFTFSANCRMNKLYFPLLLCWLSRSGEETAGHSNRIFSAHFHPQDSNVIASGGWVTMGIQWWRCRTTQLKYGTFEWNTRPAASTVLIFVVCVGSVVMVTWIGDAISFTSDGTQILTGSYARDHPLQVSPWFFWLPMQRLRTQVITLIGGVGVVLWNWNMCEINSVVDFWWQKEMLVVFCVLLQLFQVHSGRRWRGKWSQTVLRRQQSMPCPSIGIRGCCL